VRAKEPGPFDVAVIGGGPAGISACLALSRNPDLRVVLFESEPQLGGMPRSCHIFFGMRDRRWLHTGPSYALKLDGLIRKTSVNIHTNAFVMDIRPGEKREYHRLTVATPSGIEMVESKYVLLATGCYERSREARRIPGTRPAGIYTTGALQEIVNLHGLKPGKRAVLVGSEHVALSSALTLRRARVSIAGLIEEDASLHTYAIPSTVMSRFMGFPIYKRRKLYAIRGKRRVEGVELLNKESGERYELECDTIILTGRFRPDSALICGTAIQEDPQSLGPSVDMDYMTSVSNIYAAGNILRGADMHDLCALEGKTAGENILRKMSGSTNDGERCIQIEAMHPIRYVVPQRIFLGKAHRWKTSYLRPGISIQAAHTFKGVTIEAWSGTERIWRQRHSRVLADTRLLIPIEKFKWNLVDPEKAINIRFVQYTK
jgi:thioredoxin reductase